MSHRFVHFYTFMSKFKFIQTDYEYVCIVLHQVRSVRPTVDVPTAVIDYSWTKIFTNNRKASVMGEAWD